MAYHIDHLSHPSFQEVAGAVDHLESLLAKRITSVHVTGVSKNLTTLKNLQKKFCIQQLEQNYFVMT